MANLCVTFWTREQRQTANTEEQLLKNYHQILQAHGVVGYTWDDFVTDYRAGLIFWLLMPLQDRYDRGILQMPTLFLLCGLPGSGKTTLAKQLETERAALRLSPDEWIPILYGPELDQETLDGVRDPVEAMQWQVAARALQLGVDVILDWGFWGRGEREDFRAQAANLGADSKVLFLDVSREVLLARLAARNANLPPGTFHVTPEQLDLWLSWFEPPHTDEL